MFSLMFSHLRSAISFTVKPQQSASPYKKPTPPVSSVPIKPRQPMKVISPKAPDVLKGQEDDIQVTHAQLMKIVYN